MLSQVNDTHATIGGTQVAIEIGVPQGAVLSPTLFNIYIDELLIKLRRQKIKTFAFADDVAIIANGTMEFRRSLRLVKQWAHSANTSVNVKKSAILEIKVDRKTHTRSAEYEGISVLKQYRYLGLEIDDCVTVKPAKVEMKQAMKTLRRQITMAWASRIHPRHRYLAWQALIKSRVTYGLQCLSHHFETMH